jgi:ABC-type phosphate/phosphonate transport system permease subunit
VICPVDTDKTGERVVIDTNFVTAWVVVAFLVYEVAVFALGADISTLFKGWAPFMPMVGLLVGFVPGCGPQIVVTSLYLAGAIPFSAQLANAISNDGDALFPALALTPRAAILATAYSAIPALLIGYGWYFLFE